MIFTFSGCQFIRNSFTYKNTTREFVEDLLHKDYSKCMDLMFLDSARAKGIRADTLKLRLKSVLTNFTDVILNKFGSNLKYSFIQSKKTFSTNQEENTPANSTEFYMQISNDKEFGVIHALFDDRSNKIIKISLLDTEESIPDMTIFWLFGVLTLSVLAFNIYTIIKVKRSQLKRKWSLYLSIILINVPTISYGAIHGLSFELLSFQGLFGVGFSYYGYLGALWEFGIPLGSFFCLWKIYSKKNGLEEQAEIMSEATILEEESNETTSNQITE